MWYNISTVRETKTLLNKIFQTAKAEKRKGKSNVKNNQTIDILPKSAVRIQREKENTPREAKTAPNRNPANHKKERTKSDMLRWNLEKNKG